MRHFTIILLAVKLGNDFISVTPNHTMGGVSQWVLINQIMKQRRLFEVENKIDDNIDGPTANTKKDEKQKYQTRKINNDDLRKIDNE